MASITCPQKKITAGKVQSLDEVHKHLQAKSPKVVSFARSPHKTKSTGTKMSPDKLPKKSTKSSLQKSNETYSSSMKKPAASKGSANVDELSKKNKIRTKKNLNDPRIKKSAPSNFLQLSKLYGKTTGDHRDEKAKLLCQNKKEGSTTEKKASPHSIKKKINSNNVNDLRSKKAWEKERQFIHSFLNQEGTKKPKNSPGQKGSISGLSKSMTNDKTTVSKSTTNGYDKDSKAVDNESVSKPKEKNIVPKPSLEANEETLTSNQTNESEDESEEFNYPLVVSNRGVSALGIPPRRSNGKRNELRPNTPSCLQSPGTVNSQSNLSNLTTPNETYKSLVSPKRRPHSPMLKVSTEADNEANESLNVNNNNAEECKNDEDAGVSSLNVYDSLKPNLDSIQDGFYANYSEPLIDKETTDLEILHSRLRSANAHRKENSNNFAIGDLETNAAADVAINIVEVLQVCHIGRQIRNPNLVTQFWYNPM